MANLFHLAVETPQPNLVAGIKWFLRTYTGVYERSLIPVAAGKTPK
jgi:hypothetical protein